MHNMTVEAKGRAISTYDETEMLCYVENATFAKFETEKKPTTKTCAELVPNLPKIPKKPLKQQQQFAIPAAPINISFPKMPLLVITPTN
ncbi:hypothetical protein LXL04_019181 [Taraxacum kok-saghyz]